MNGTESPFQGACVTIHVTIEREFVMDMSRVLGEPSFAPPPADASDADREKWLRESFYELCGIDRERDHIDGSYVQMTWDSVDVEFDWPDG